MFKLAKSVSFVGRIKNGSANVANGIKNKYAAFEKRVEGTFAEKWLRFWVNVARDYRDVAVDIAKEAREKPSKAIIIGTSGWLATMFAVHNPNATHYRDAFQQASNEAAIVHHTLVKPEVLQYLKHIEQAYNNHLVRHTNLGLFSIVWIDKDSDVCAAYETQCNYLQLGYKDIYDRIIDVGFLDTWWGLVKNMKDYDINY